MHRQMTLPARSTAYWYQWTTFCPIVDFCLGSLSPELEDVDLSNCPQVPQLPDSDILTIACGLNPTLFQDDISKTTDGRATWTKNQRSKATSCPVIHTADELSAWVS